MRGEHIVLRNDCRAKSDIQFGPRDHVPFRPCCVNLAQIDLEQFYHVFVLWNAKISFRNRSKFLPVQFYFCGSST